MSDQLLLAMPGLDRVHHAPFVMPDAAARNGEMHRAIARMNTVRLTVDQFERGLAVYHGTAKGDHFPGVGARRLAALIAFCVAEGIEPADVAAHAILFRCNPIAEAECNGYDIKNEDPKAYASCVTGPIEAWRYAWGDESTAA